MTRSHLAGKIAPAADLPELFGSPENAMPGAELLKAIAHPLRLCIVARLCAGPTSVSELAEELGTAQALVSQQLAILRVHRIVEYSIEARRRVYRLAEPRVRHMLHCLGACLRERAERGTL